MNTSGQWAVASGQWCEKFAATVRLIAANCRPMPNVPSKVSLATDHCPLPTALRTRP